MQRTWLEASRRDAAEKQLPDFVEVRIRSHYERYERSETLWGGNHLLHGRHPGSDALFLSSNDYLCLLGEPGLKQAQADALLRGTDALLMSAIFLHGDTPQSRFEKRLGQFMGAEDGLLCQSGWAANVGLIQSIAGPRAPVYLDRIAHDSLWEGAHAAKARVFSFPHNDAAQAEQLIRENGPGVIAVDSVYSTNGSLCPVADFVEVAERTGSVLVVDESHSLGTHGPAGAGVVAGLGLAGRVHFRTASLSKAFAGRAGFFSCCTRFKEYFAMESRQAIFSSSLLSHEVAWLEAALDFIARADHRRARLFAVARQVRSGLAALGYNVSEGSEQIVTLEVGTEPQTKLVRDALQAKGIFGAVFCAPATARNRALIRMTMNSGLSEAQIQRLLQACAELREDVDVTSWSSTLRVRQ